MTIEEITYYIETEIKEDEFYGADCDLRRKAHIEILECLEELQAHREAWKKVEDKIKITKLGYANSDSIACMAEIRAFNRSLEIIEEYRPKEGDADETTK